MAEPYNTPVPGSTPRSGSPLPHPRHPVSLTPASGRALSPSTVTTGRSLSPSDTATAGASPPHDTRRRVLHLGDPVCINVATHHQLISQYNVIRPSTPERERKAFAQNLRDGTWGDFEAIMRPYWPTGGEMGDWDETLISLLPPTVKVFASAGTGYDWVDVEALSEKGRLFRTQTSRKKKGKTERHGILILPGILFCNGGTYASDAVADMTVAMIISTFRDLPLCINSALSNSPSQFTACHLGQYMRGLNLRFKPLGIIGLGSIGLGVATRCSLGFQMDIHYYDVQRKPAEVELGVSATFHDSLESLLSAVDCVVLCIPSFFGADTIIHESTLAHFRPGARFVNVARGALINEDDLVKAVETGQLSSVALDVFDTEPHIHPGLRKLAADGRALLTCHNAGGTAETTAGCEGLSMRNVLAVLAGAEPLSAVNRGAGSTCWTGATVDCE